MLGQEAPQQNTSPNWPTSPTPDSSASAKTEDGSGKIAPVTEILKPQAKILSEDPLQKIDDTKTVTGELLYTPTLKIEGVKESQVFLVLRGIGVEKQAEGTPTLAATYRLQVPWYYVFGSQFSPNGRYILFNEGDPLERPTYQPFIWDTIGKRLSRIEPDVLLNLYYNDIYWSPGSTRVAFVANTGKPEVALNVYNAQTHAQSTIAKNISVAGGVAWTYQGTLLYSPALESSDTYDPARMKIYQSRLDDGIADVVLEGGTNPTPAPQGRWLTFIGAPAPPATDAQANATNPGKPQPALYLFDQQTNTRVLLSRQTPDAVRWTPDGQQLVVLHTRYLGKGQREARVSVFDLGEIVNNLEAPTQADVKAPRELATLPAQNYQPVDRGNVNFRIMDVTRDGSHVLIDVSELLGFDHNLPTESKTLQAVSLRDGTVSTVAHLESKWASVIGWDWHDESEPTATPFEIKAAQIEAKIGAPAVVRGK